MAFCSGPFLLSELGRSGEFTLTLLIICLSKCVQTLWQTEVLSLFAVLSRWMLRTTIMWCHLLLIGSFRKNSGAGFLVARFFMTAHIFQCLPSELGGGSLLQILEEDGRRTQVLFCSHFRVILCNVSFFFTDLSVAEHCSWHVLYFSRYPRLFDEGVELFTFMVEVENFGGLSTFYVFML
jgi:hypothetical protein